VGKSDFKLYFYKDALRHFYKTVKYDRFREDQYCISVCFLRMKMFKELFEMFPEEKLEKNPIPFIWSTLGDA
jgi:hypothetical protein